MFEKIIREMALLEEVEAIMLGGSRATKQYDEYSDYDVYIYLNKPLKEEKRRKILDPYVSYMEYSNSFWELEDDGVLNNGVEIEFIYRDLQFLPTVLDNLFVYKNTGNGYTTCFFDNLMDSVLLHEKNGYISNLVQTYKSSYTPEISRLIIDNNVPLLRDVIPALFHQIKKSTLRNDLVAINHRISTFMEIYFDVLFALNQEPHPGEKRMLENALRLSVKPLNLDTLVNQVFQNQYRNYDVLLLTLNQMIDEIEELIRKKQV